MVNELTYSCVSVLGPVTRAMMASPSSVVCLSSPTSNVVTRRRGGCRGAPMAPCVHRYGSRRALVVRRADQAGSDQQEKKRSPKTVNSFRPPSKEEASLRAEAEAPFRSFRIVIFGFGVISAGLATLFSIPTLIGALAGAPNAKDLTEALQDILINVTALGVCGYLLRGDLEAREKQMARLLREDQLGMCQVELANKKVLRLGQLRGAARPVIVVGSQEQVRSALKLAEKYREPLMERGVLVIGIPVYDDGEGAEGAAEDIPELVAEDLRWRAKPLRVNEWKAWFDEQAGASGKTVDKGLVR